MRRKTRWRENPGTGWGGLECLDGAKLAGAWPLVAVDTLPSKFTLAKRLGVDVTVNATEGDPVAAVRDVTGGGAEYAFEAVGNANVLAQAYVDPILLIFFGLVRPLLGILHLHPTNEENADDDDIEEVAGYPHNETTKLLIKSGRNTPDTWCAQVWRI